MFWPGVDLGTGVEEDLDNVDVAPWGRQAEGGVVRHITVLLISPAEQQ